MNTIGSSSANVYSPQSVRAHAQSTAAQQPSGEADKPHQDRVTLSAEGKALLGALKEIDKQSKAEDEQNKTVVDKVESFTYGALGMDHPDEVKEEVDSSYSAGKYASAALTIGGILLALI